MRLSPFATFLMIAVLLGHTVKADPKNCTVMNCTWALANRIIIAPNSVTPDCACVMGNTYVVFTPANSASYFVSTPFLGNQRLVPGFWPAQVNNIQATYPYRACYFFSATESSCPDPKLIVKSVTQNTVTSSFTLNWVSP